MKQLLAILLTLALVLSFGGCARKDRVIPAPQSGGVPTISPEPVAAVPTRSAPDHITADLGNNITVAAAIDQPADGGSLGVYQVEAMTLDGETALSLLLGEGYQPDPETPSTKEAEYYEKGNRGLILRNGRTGLTLYSRESGGADLFNTLDVTQVVLETEPDFMSRQEAIRLAQDALKGLGISDTQVVRCVPIDQAGLAALAAECRDYFGGSEEDAALYTACPPCYVIDLCQTAGGVPLYHDFIQLTAGDAEIPDRVAIQPSLRAVVTAEGLYELEVDDCIAVGAQVQVGVKVLTAEEMAAAIGKCYEDIINTDPTVIRSLSLRYAALPVSLQGQERQLRPIWVVQGVRSVYEPQRGGEPMEFPLTLFFDAVTGQLVEDGYK